jgi:hypothetical protein
MAMVERVASQAITRQEIPGVFEQEQGVQETFLKKCSCPLTSCSKASWYNAP